MPIRTTRPSASRAAAMQALPGSAGDLVEFTGQVVAHDPGFAAQVGVDPDGGAAQLTVQAAHIDVPQSELRGTGG